GSWNPPGRRPQIAKTPLPTAVRLGVLRQQIQRARPFRLPQRSLDRLNAPLAGDLVTRHLQERLLRKCLDGPAVTPNERLRRLPTGGATVTGLLARQHNTRRHALEVPLPWPADGLVEIVQIEDQPAIRRSEGPQVLHMRIPA